MVGEIRAQDAEPQFGSYVAELRDYLRSRGLALGGEDSLAGLLQRLGEDLSFADELGSLLRAFSYTEAERMGRPELLTLLIEAASGLDRDRAMQSNPSLLRPLFTFVSETLRPPTFWTPDTLEDEEADAGTAGLGEPASAAADATPEPPSVPAHRSSGREEVYLRAQQLAEQQSQGVSSLASSPTGSFRERSPEPVFQSAPAVFAALPVPATQPPARASVPPPSDALRTAAPGLAGRAPAKGLGQRWIVPVVIGGLAILGVGAFFVRPPVQHDADPSLAASLATGSVTTPASTPCVAGMSGATSRVALEERSHWAQRLLDQKLYTSAMPELQEIARLDPGFPGINLDESGALLHLGRLDEAQVAADAQIGIAECLEHLPSTSLEAYCSAQYANDNTAGCRPQLAHLRQAAELQSALVHLEIDHGNNAVTAAPALRGSSASRRQPRKASAAERRSTPFPAATEDDNMVPAVSPSRP